MVASTRKIRLGKRDRLIIWHVYRFGVTHTEVVYRLFYDSDTQKKEAARSTLRRLTEGGYLRENTNPWPHFRLAAAAAGMLEHALGLPKDALRATTRRIKAVTALRERCVILAHCCLSDREGTLLTRPEFEHWFPEYFQRGVRPGPFFLATDDALPRLELLVVDSASQMPMQLRRVEKAFTRQLAIPAFRELERHGRCRINWLTPAERRATEFEQALKDSDLRVVTATTVPMIACIPPDLHLLR